MKAVIDTSDFNRLVSATKDFVSTNKSRPVQNLIHLTFNSEERKVTAVALDGYRLSVEHAVADSDCDFDVFIYPNAKFKADDTLEIKRTGDRVFLYCGETSIGYKMPSGEVFDYKKALPQKEPTLRIGFNPRYLMQAFKAAAASLGRSNKSAVLEFYSPLDPVIIRTNDEGIKMVLPCRIREANR